MRVLVTRPLPDGERTAAALRARGYQVLLAPLMKVKSVTADLSGDWAAVIVSSANALRALEAGQLAPLKNLPLFAVGERTAAAAREAGFGDVRAAHGDAGDLIRLVSERYAGQSAPHLYLAGEDRAADIEGELARRGIQVRTVVVYKNVTTGFPPELVRALTGGLIGAVLHFSRRSAENYVAGARDAGLAGPAVRPRHFCLSPQVAEPLQALGIHDAGIAARPDEAALLDLLPKPSP
jgi:uroporphyrinogen-III synthase